MSRPKQIRLRRVFAWTVAGLAVALLGALLAAVLVVFPAGSRRNGQSSGWRTTRLLEPREWGFGANPNGRVIVRAPARPGQAVRLICPMPPNSRRADGTLWRHDDIWLSRNDGCTLVAQDGVVSAPRPDLPKPPTSVTAHCTVDLGKQSPLSFGWSRDDFYWPVRGRTVRIGFIEIGSCPDVSVRRENTRAGPPGKP